MNRTEHVRLMATYNEWMNRRLYEACATLAPERLAADRKAFFGSIIGTLNHLLNADLIWLGRFAAHPAHYPGLAGLPKAQPGQLGAVRHADFASLRQERRLVDAAILALAGAISEADLDQHLRFTSSQGQPYDRSFFNILMHFFNHQTHHRGQVTTLLSQEGVDMGATDLMVLDPAEAAA
jgi:uncharacterized damage-inducible protein DinB